MDPRELLKRAKRPPPSALVPASDGSKRPSSLKNRIRGLERLINKPGLPAAAVKDKKRLLKKLQQQLADAKFDAREHKVGARYHKVKFFERRKVTRALNRATKELAAATAAAAAGDGDDDDTAALAARIQGLQEQLLYIRWYPRHVKYLSLFPKAQSKDPKHDGRVSAMRTWALCNAEKGEYLRDKPPAPPADVAAVIRRRLSVAVQRGEELVELDDEGDGGVDAEHVVSSSDAPGSDDDDEEDSDADDSSDEESDDDSSSSDDDDDDDKAPAPKKPAPQQKKPAAAAAGAVAASSGSSAAAGGKAPAKAGAATAAPARRTAVVLPPAADEDDGSDADDGGADLTADAFFTAAPTVGGGAGGSAAAAGANPDYGDDGLPVFFEEDDGPGGPGDYTVAGADYRGHGEEKYRPSAAGMKRPRDAAGSHEYPEDGDEDPNDRARMVVHGPYGSAARYEREHMNAKRYRDTAAARRPPSAAASGPDLSHLSGRKLRRAQRAQSFAASKGAGAGGGLMPTLPHYSESFYGTERDPGARLRSDFIKAPTAGPRGGGAGGSGAYGAAGAGSRPRAGGGAGAGGGFGGRAPAAAAAAPAADLSHLTGRALKRAQRAAEHQAKKAGGALGGGGAAVSAPAAAAAPARPAAAAAAVATGGSGGGGGGYENLAHLTGRALKRAQRALEHQAKKAGGGGGGGGGGSATDSVAASAAAPAAAAAAGGGHKRIKFVDRAS